MVHSSDNQKKLPGSSLFSEVAHQIRTCQEEHPERKMICPSIGDVTRTLVSAVIEAFYVTVDEQAHAAIFHSCGPEQSCDFLRTTISAAGA